jgi:hypothetical protein
VRGSEGETERKREGERERERETKKRSYMKQQVRINLLHYKLNLDATSHPLSFLFRRYVVTLLYHLIKFNNKCFISIIIRVRIRVRIRIRISAELRVKERARVKGSSWVME